MVTTPIALYHLKQSRMSRESFSADSVAVSGRMPRDVAESNNDGLSLSRSCIQEDGYRQLLRALDPRLSNPKDAGLLEGLGL